MKNRRWWEPPCLEMVNDYQYLKIPIKPAEAGWEIGGWGKGKGKTSRGEKGKGTITEGIFLPQTH